jgi:hypothetical protein
MKTLTDRKEIAQALNFGKYPVLKWDIDKREGSKAVVIKQSARYGEMRYGCKLFNGYEKENDGTFWLMKKATMIKGHYGIDDYLEDADFANAPVIESNQDVAILCYSRLANTAFVVIVNAGKVTTDYSTAAKFE